MRAMSIAVLLTYLSFSPQYALGQIDLVSGEVTLDGFSPCDFYESAYGDPPCVPTGFSETTVIDPSVSSFSESVDLSAAFASVDFVQQGGIIDLRAISEGSLVMLDFFGGISIGDSTSAGLLIFDLAEPSSLQASFSGSVSSFSLEASKFWASKRRGGFATLW